jgi:hypothetical protein
MAAEGDLRPPFWSEEFCGDYTSSANGEILDAENEQGEDPGFRRTLLREKDGVSGTMYTCAVDQDLWPGEGQALEVVFLYRGRELPKGKKKDQAVSKWCVFSLRSPSIDLVSHRF